MPRNRDRCKRCGSQLAWEYILYCKFEDTHKEGMGTDTIVNELRASREERMDDILKWIRP